MLTGWGKIVTHPADVEDAVRDGYDHVQLIIDNLMGLDEDQFSNLRKDLARHDIAIELCSSPLPPEVIVTEMGFNLYVWTEYIKKAARRVESIGCPKIGWNNGRSRVLPWEGDIAAVKEQVLQFLFMLCDVSEESGITVLIEPLSPLRTNFLNTMDEIEKFLPRVGKDNLAAMISLRDLADIELPLEKIKTYANLISYVHLENPLEAKAKRTPPRPEDGYDYQPFLRALKEINYSGAICLPEESDSTTLTYCRELWDAS